jgi:starch phosphorylase
MEYDEYMLMADYLSYIKCQENVSRTYTDKMLWTRMSILNVSRMGFFSSDRAVKQYCEEIWHTRPVRITKAEKHNS